RFRLKQYREAVVDAEEALSHGKPTPRLLYGVARTYAQAADLAATDTRLRSDAGPCSVRYEKRALILLQQAIEAQPATDRKAFWQNVIQTDDALEPLRKRSQFVRMIAAYLTPTR